MEHQEPFKELNKNLKCVSSGSSKYCFSNDLTKDGNITAKSAFLLKQL